MASVTDNQNIIPQQPIDFSFVPGTAEGNIAGTNIAIQQPNLASQGQENVVQPQDQSIVVPVPPKPKKQPTQQQAQVEKGPLPGLAGIGPGPKQSKKGEEVIQPVITPQQEVQTNKTIADTLMGKISNIAKSGQKVDDAMRNKLIQDTIREFGGVVDMNNPQSIEQINKINQFLLSKAGTSTQEQFTAKMNQPADKAGQYNNMQVYDLAFGLKSGTIKDVDLDGLKITDPTKYDQTIRLRNTLKMMDERNTRLSKETGDKKTTTTPVVEVPVQQTPEDIVKQSQEAIKRGASYDLVGLYKSMTDTAEMKGLQGQIKPVAASIQDLNRKKENLRNDIEKEFPTAITKSALDALYYDRVEDIDRELKVKLDEYNILKDDYDSKTKEAQNMFGIVSKQLEKQEDREFQKYTNALDFQQRKDLMVFDNNLKLSVPDLDKIPNDDGSVSYFDKRTMQIVATVNPADKGSLLNYFKPDGSTGGSCVQYGNDIVQKAGGGRPFSGSDQSIQGKINVLSRPENVLQNQSGVPGSIMVYDSGAMSADGKTNYGHIGVVSGIVEKDGKQYYSINDSNRDKNNKVKNHDIPVDDPKIKGFYATQTMLGQNTGGGLKVGSKEYNKQYGVANRQLADDMEKGNKDFNEVNRSYQGIKAIVDKGLNSDNKAAFDQALIMMFNKVLDPGSVVKEGEYNRSTQEMALLDQVTANANRVIYGGAAISDTMRQQMVKASKVLYDSMVDGYNVRKKKWGNSAQLLGADPALVDVYMPSIGEGTATQSSVPGSFSANFESKFKGNY